jgi:UDP-N-acetylglucosamine 1-carboxyvinyltransferase
VDRLIIRGGKHLRGELEVSGAKNAALPLLCATLLADGASVLRNVPALRDIDTTCALLRNHGAAVRHERNQVRVDTAAVRHFEAPYDLVRTMRASVLVLGPLVARHGRARVSLPGGCAIGARPVNLHLAGLERLGAKITLDGGYVDARARRLKGARIVLDFPSVGATENLLMAATLASGRTILENAAQEPEIGDLATALRGMGAEIEGDGTPTITIAGKKRLRPMDHATIPDRIEAGTFMIAAALTRGDVLLKGYRLGHLDAVVDKLHEAGAEVDQGPAGVRVRARGDFRAVDVRTLPFPGFPTDMQAQFMTLMTLARGQSVVTETVFENRFMHVSELRRLGADVRVEGHSAVVRGVERLSGAPTIATDLRASASLVLAGLVARGQTEVRRVYHLDRGYEKIEVKLRKLGADIMRLHE